MDLRAGAGRALAAVGDPADALILKRLLRHERLKALGVAALGAYLRFALRTTRWTLVGAEQLGRHMEAHPAIFAFWHERLPMMPALWTLAVRTRAARGTARGRMHVLVSRHQDGRMIGSMMRGFGLDLVHGSSTKPGARRSEQKGGASSLRTLLGLLEAGDQMVITPDGPRGPRRELAPGVAQLAALSGVPVVPCAAQTTRRRVLPSWDRMVLPLPWGRGVLVCGAPITVDRGAWGDAMPVIAAALNAAADAADARCSA